MDHYVSRVRGTMQLLQQHDIVGRTSELARLFGIQFYHVLTRGSQVPTDLTSCHRKHQGNPGKVMELENVFFRAWKCLGKVMEIFYKENTFEVNFEPEKLKH